jgi:hypothetical protein
MSLLVKGSLVVKSGINNAKIQKSILLTGDM